MTREEFLEKWRHTPTWSEAMGIVWDEIHAADKPADVHQCTPLSTSEPPPHHLVFDGPETTLAECRPGMAWVTTAINSTSLVMIVETCLGLIAYGGEGAASFKHDAEDLRVRPLRLAPGAVPVEDYPMARIQQLCEQSEKLSEKLAAAEADRDRRDQAFARAMGGTLAVASIRAYGKEAGR